jgi:hypothetical protein
MLKLHYPRLKRKRQRLRPRMSSQSQLPMLTPLRKRKKRKRGQVVLKAKKARRVLLEVDQQLRHLLSKE